MLIIIVGQECWHTVIETYIRVHITARRAIVDIENGSITRVSDCERVDVKCLVTRAAYRHVRNRFRRVGRPVANVGAVTQRPHLVVDILSRCDRVIRLDVGDMVNNNCTQAKINRGRTVAQMVISHGVRVVEGHVACDVAQHLDRRRGVGHDKNFCPLAHIRVDQPPHKSARRERSAVVAQKCGA